MVSSVPFVKALDLPVSESGAVAPGLPTAHLSRCTWDVCNLPASYVRACRAPVSQGCCFSLIAFCWLRFNFFFNNKQPGPSQRTSHAHNCSHVSAQHRIKCTLLSRHWFLFCGIPLSVLDPLHFPQRKEGRRGILSSPFV